jgi:hypothetical protein
MLSGPEPDKNQERLQKKQLLEEKKRLALEKSDASEMKALRLSPTAGRKQLLAPRHTGTMKSNLGA